MSFRTSLVRALSTPGWCGRASKRTAIAHDLTLVTRNVKDVHGTGVRTLNPFSR